MTYQVKASKHSKNFFYIFELFADGDPSDDVFGPIHINDLTDLRNQITKVIEAKAAAAKVREEINDKE